MRHRLERGRGEAMSCVRAGVLIAIGAEPAGSSGHGGDRPGRRGVEDIETPRSRREPPLPAASHMVAPGKVSFYARGVLRARHRRPDPLCSAKVFFSPHFRRVRSSATWWMRRGERMGITVREEADVRILELAGEFALGSRLGRVPFLDRCRPR